MNAETFIKSSISSELNGILNGGSPPIQSRCPAPAVRSRGLDYIEQPMAGHSESMPAGVSSSPINMIPIDDDMSERIKRMLQEEQGIHPPNTPSQPSNNSPVTTIPPPSTISTPTPITTPSIDIPKDFDFDLFHMATLRDIVGTLNEVIKHTEDKLNSLKDIKHKIEKNLR